MLRIIDMHAKYDNIHENGMFNALICINNHIITSINFMLSILQSINCIERERAGRARAKEERGGGGVERDTKLGGATT